MAVAIAQSMRLLRQPTIAGCNAICNCHWFDWDCSQRSLTASLMWLMSAAIQWMSFMLCVCAFVRLCVCAFVFVVVFVFVIVLNTHSHCRTTQNTAYTWLIHWRRTSASISNRMDSLFQFRIHFHFHFQFQSNSNSNIACITIQIRLRVCVCVFVLVLFFVCLFNCVFVCILCNYKQCNWNVKQKLNWNWK